MESASKLNPTGGWNHADSLSTLDSVIVKSTHHSRSALDRSLQAQSSLSRVEPSLPSTLFDMIIARLVRLSCSNDDLLQAMSATQLPPRASLQLARLVHRHWPRSTLLDPKLPYALWLALVAQNDLPQEYMVYTGLSLADSPELQKLHERKIWRSLESQPFSFVTVLDLQDATLKEVCDDFINMIRRALGRSLVALRLSHNRITDKSAQYLTSASDFQLLRLLSLEGCREITPHFATRLHLLPSLAIIDLRNTNCSASLVQSALKNAINTLSSEHKHFHLAKSTAERSLISTQQSLVTSLRKYDLLVSRTQSLPSTVLINSLSRTSADVSSLPPKPKSSNSTYTSVHGRVSGTATISASTLKEDAAIANAKGAAFRTGKGENVAMGKGMDRGWDPMRYQLKKNDLRLNSVESEDEEDEEEVIEGEGVRAGQFHRLPTLRKKDKTVEPVELGSLVFVRFLPALKIGYQPGQAVAEEEKIKSSSTHQARPKGTWGRPAPEPVKTRTKPLLGQSRSAASLLDAILPPVAKKPKLYEEPTSSFPQTQPSTFKKASLGGLSSRKKISPFRRG